MPLRYNFGQAGIIIPNVLSRLYKYTRLDKVYELEVDKKKVSFNSEKRISDAWKYIEEKCARNKECNDYFAKLYKAKTLADILKNVNFTVHRLAPKENYKEADMPAANSAGSDFALSIRAFVSSPTVEELAATILHEIAHFAGATTNPREDDPKNLAAEKSLIPCGLGKYYNEENRG